MQLRGVSMFELSMATVCNAFKSGSLEVDQVREIDILYRFLGTSDLVLMLKYNNTDNLG